MSDLETANARLIGAMIDDCSKFLDGPRSNGKLWHGH